MWGSAGSCVALCVRSSALTLAMRLRFSDRAATMGYDKAIFVSEVPDVDGYECVICQDVVEDAVQCQQGHTCAPRGATRTCLMPRHTTFGVHA